MSIWSSHPRLGLRGALSLLLLLALTFALARSTDAFAAYAGAPTQIAYVNPSQALSMYEPGEYTGTEGNNTRWELGVESGTSPSIAGSKGVAYSYQIAFHASGGEGLWTVTSPNTVKREGLGMSPGTSPSETTWSEGFGSRWNFAFQGNTGVAWLNHTSLGLLMAQGTSPGVIPAGVVAFQSRSGHLAFYYPWTGGISETGLGMAGGSSPSIVELGLGGGYEVAFRAAGSNHLWLFNGSGGFDTGLGIEAGSNPAIGYVGGTWITAFQAGGSRHLWTYTSSGIGTDLGVSVQAGTSPSISERAGASWEVAFQSTNHDLSTDSPLGAVDTRHAMLANSSPSITP
jgi:hypothetical protein